MALAGGASSRNSNDPHHASLTPHPQGETGQNRGLVTSRRYFGGTKAGTTAFAVVPTASTVERTTGKPLSLLSACE
jgi:hypothetical protein